MAAGATYTPIATTTLGSDTATVTFSSIPNTYTDLVLIADLAQTTANYNNRIRLNSDTGSNYSYTELAGTTIGSPAYQSWRNSNATSFSTTGGNQQPFTAVGSNTFIANFMNYSNTTTYKTIIARWGGVDGSFNLTASAVFLYRSTSAISTIEIGQSSTDKYKTGTVFTLYGIVAA